MAEFFKYECGAYPIYEFTSSGMTHTATWHYGFVGEFYLNYFLPYWFNEGPLPITVKNFGVVEIDWTKKSRPKLNLVIMDENGVEQASLKIDTGKKSEADVLCGIEPPEMAVNFVLSLVV